MPTIKGTKKQARKRHRQSLERRDRNRAVRSRVRRQMRKMREAVAAGDAEAIRQLLPETYRVI
ncbi:MAG TPA: 30S ribosomal protein S20, partial [Candidatus Sulfomarinibacteraceae bacterium]|nr:30S ribosomal protein S20 [Candidatus Sulfomarinibacteraceae bacterium]